MIQCNRMLKYKIIKKFDKRITLRLHIEMIEAKALRKFIRIYSILKSEFKRQY
jgi:hypothetical protein